MTDMHRAPGLKFPKSTTAKVDRVARRLAFIRRDRKGSRQAKGRADGRCEAVVNGQRCPWQGRHVHHMISGIGKRGHGISALAERKQYVCFEHHELIHQNKIERIGVDVPHYTDTYQTRRPDHAKKIRKATGC